jgi:hypothetical protein
MPPVRGDDNDAGYGVFGQSTYPFGVGVLATSRFFMGLYGASEQSNGVYGESRWVSGVRGYSDEAVGVDGESRAGVGVVGRSDFIGVSGRSKRWFGVIGQSERGPGVAGFSTSDAGVFGRSRFFAGVSGFTERYYGVYGRSWSGIGVYGESEGGHGVHGRSGTNIAIDGHSDYIGVAGFSDGVAVFGLSNRGYAAQLLGRVYIRGPLEKPGGSFKIDHPLDPANKYLHHSFVESPDMKNVYDGVVVLDDKGEAVVDLPDWFSALNKDFRYQLTAIGVPGPNLYIAEEISGAESTSSNYYYNKSKFKIAGGMSGMKVSWQVTGIRKDPWANANRIQVEEDKPAKEQGYYIYPDLYGQPEEKGISHLLFPDEKLQEQLARENKQP